MNINGLLQRENDYIAAEQYEEAYELLKSGYEEHKNNAEFLEHIALLAKSIGKNWLLLIQIQLLHTLNY